MVQVFMVIFDIMVSHYNMLRWHEAGLTQHKGDLAAIQAAKLACKQRLLLQSSHQSAPANQGNCQQQPAVHQSALDMVLVSTQPVAVAQPQQQTPQAASHLSTAGGKSGEVFKSDVAAPSNPVALATSANAGPQLGPRQLEDSLAHVQLDRSRAAVDAAAELTVPHIATASASLQHAQPGSLHTGSLAGNPASPPTPEPSSTSEKGRPVVTPAAAGQPVTPLQSAVSGFASKHGQQQQQPATSLQQAVSGSTSSPGQQQPPTGVQAKLTVRFDSQVPAAPPQAEAAAFQQQRQGRHPAHHSAHAAGEKVHAGQQPAKHDEQQQWRAELEVSCQYLECMYVPAAVCVPAPVCMCVCVCVCSCMCV